MPLAFACPTHAACCTLISAVRPKRALGPFRPSKGSQTPPMPAPAEPPAEAVSSARRLRHVLPTLLHQPSQQPGSCPRCTLSTATEAACPAPPQRRLHEGFSLPLALLGSSFERAICLACALRKGARPPSTDHDAAASSASPPLAAGGRVDRSQGSPDSLSRPLFFHFPQLRRRPLHATAGDRVCSKHRYPRRTAKTAAHDSPLAQGPGAAGRRKGAK